MGSLADEMAARSPTVDTMELWETANRSGILLTVNDKPGVLNVALQILATHNINLTSIHSIPPKKMANKKVMNIAIDFEGNYDMPNVQAALKQLEAISDGVTKVGVPEVPWFPT